MNALDLLSGDEGEASDEEQDEPEAKRQKSGQLDFKDLQRLGYAAGGEDDEKAKMKEVFSSLDKVTSSQKADAPIEIPGFATMYTIVLEGDPVRIVSEGTKVIAHATGRFAKTGKVFWDTRETVSGKPHLFLAGAGKKVVGWEQGCMGMKMGEVRKLFVPSKEGYGVVGCPDAGIPPHTDLEFTVECLDIASAEAKAPIQHAADIIWRRESSSDCKGAYTV